MKMNWCRSSRGHRQSRQPARSSSSFAGSPLRMTIQTLAAWNNVNAAILVCCGDLPLDISQTHRYRPSLQHRSASWSDDMCPDMVFPQSFSTRRSFQSRQHHTRRSGRHCARIFLSSDPIYAVSSPVKRSSWNLRGNQGMLDTPKSSCGPRVLSYLENISCGTAYT
jgi:hypothetical protein